MRLIDQDGVHTETHSVDFLLMRCRRQYMPLDGNNYPEGSTELLQSKDMIKAHLGDNQCWWLYFALLLIVPGVQTWGIHPLKSSYLNSWLILNQCKAYDYHALDLLVSHELNTLEHLYDTAS